MHFTFYSQSTFGGHLENEHQDMRLVRNNFRTCTKEYRDGTYLVYLVCTMFKCHILWCGHGFFYHIFCIGFLSQSLETS